MRDELFISRTEHVKPAADIVEYGPFRKTSYRKWDGAQERNHGGFADEDRRHSMGLKINHGDEEMEKEMDVE